MPVTATIILLTIAYLITLLITVPFIKEVDLAREIFPRSRRGRQIGNLLQLILSPVIFMALVVYAAIYWPYKLATDAERRQVVAKEIRDMGAWLKNDFKSMLS